MIGVKYNICLVAKIFIYLFVTTNEGAGAVTHLKLRIHVEKYSMLLIKPYCIIIDNARIESHLNEKDYTNNNNNDRRAT